MVLRLRPTTLVIKQDEPCFNLSELNQLSPPPNQKLHRYRVVLVIRDDRLAEYRHDLGPTENFTRPEFRIPGGVSLGGGKVEILHTVAELQEIADHLRNEPWSLPFQPADLTQEYYNYIDQLPRFRRHQSTFGPLARLQR